MSAFRNSPCKDCKDRTVEPNCHTTCEKYLEAKALHDEKKQRIYDAKMKENVDRDRSINKNLRRVKGR